MHVKRRMKGTVAILLAYLLLPLTAAHAQNEQDKTTGGAQRLTTGRITKIDTKKRTLKVRTQADNPTSSTPRQPQGSGRRGGRRRSGGIPFPGPGGTGGGRQPTSTTKDQGKEFKVTVTDKTVFKDRENSISFLNLNVGDRILIQGFPKGSGDDLEATQITITNH